MGYLHIENLYKNKDILLFKECYALEKIHGCSAHIQWKDKLITYFPGGIKLESFVKIFNNDFLKSKFSELAINDIIIYGEVYGGACQKMSDVYGKNLKFIAFDVKIEDVWLCVPDAFDICSQFNIEFVHYEKVKTEIEILDKLANDYSIQSIRNGIKEPKKREGIVLRPLVELIKNNGSRIISKHKNDTFKEREHLPKISEESLKIYEEAQSAVNEFVTEMRLSHILGKLTECNIEDAGMIIKFMIEDVFREAKGEIIENTEIKKLIGKKTAIMFKQRIVDKLKTGSKNI